METRYTTYDYLDWLKEEEEYLLYCLEMSCDDLEEIEEKLQIVREIKQIVKDYEGRDGESD